MAFVGQVYLSFGQTLYSPYSVTTKATDKVVKHPQHNFYKSMHIVSLRSFHIDKNFFDDRLIFNIVGLLLLLFVGKVYSSICKTVPGCRSVTTIATYKVVNKLNIVSTSPCIINAAYINSSFSWIES